MPVGEEPRIEFLVADAAVNKSSTLGQYVLSWETGWM